MDQPYSATVDAGGRATIVIRPFALMTWVVSQVSVEMRSAPVGAACTLRKNGRFITALIPTGDAAGGDPPVDVGPSDRLTVEFVGCTPGTSGEALVIYEEVRR